MAALVFVCRECAWATGQAELMRLTWHKGQEKWGLGADGVQLPQLGATCPEGREAADINQPSQHTVCRGAGSQRTQGAPLFGWCSIKKVSGMKRRSRGAAECPVEGGGGDEEGGAVVAAGGHCSTHRQRGCGQRG